VKLYLHVLICIHDMVLKHKGNFTFPITNECSKINKELQWLNLQKKKKKKKRVMRVGREKNPILKRNLIKT
jgi:hypothetical protein